MEPDVVAARTVSLKLQVTRPLKVGTVPVRSSRFIGTPSAACPLQVPDYQLTINGFGGEEFGFQRQVMTEFLLWQSCVQSFTQAQQR